MDFIASLGPKYLLFLAVAGVGTFIATKRNGWNPYFWTFMAVVLPVLALPLLFIFLPPYRRRPSTPSEPPAPPSPRIP
jgi:hypothetical protein